MMSQSYNKMLTHVNRLIQGMLLFKQDSNTIIHRKVEGQGPLSQP